MSIDKLKFTDIAKNTAIMITDKAGVMRWANDSYAKLTGLHLPTWLHRDSGDISRVGYIRLHGNSKLMYESVQETGYGISRTIDFPNAKSIITTAVPVEESEQLKSIVYILTLPNDKPSPKRGKDVISKIDIPGIINPSSAMQRVYFKALQLAPFNTPLVISGESGVGKDVLARFIHSASPRKERNFIHINCSALPEALFESEMFGYESGAFTGALKNGKAGLVELAHGGTLFLDEVGELPLPLQAKLLTFLSTGEFIKVGGSKPIKVDIRVIAATNKNLKSMVNDKLFRNDLFYRLSTFELFIPPLRERICEIPNFIEHYTEFFNKKYNKEVVFTDEVIEIICALPWHGNIRELASVIERLILFSTRNTITAEYFFAEHATEIESTSVDTALRTQVEMYEKQLIQRALSSSRNMSDAALKLQIDLSTLTRKRQKYAI